MNINPFKDEKQFKRITLENAEEIKFNNGILFGAFYMYVGFAFLEIDKVLSILLFSIGVISYIIAGVFNIKNTNKIKKYYNE